jgi:deoxyribodipyrimidine photo-lyase
LAGQAPQALASIAARLGAQHVFAGRDYEPEAIERDERSREALAAVGSALNLVKEHVIFESWEIRTQAGKAFSVFTPYRAAWLRELGLRPPTPRDTSKELRELGLSALTPSKIPSLAELGFEPSDLDELDVDVGEGGARAALKRFGAHVDLYGARRDFPIDDAGSRLGVHLRFGTLSIREAVSWARARGGDGAQTWISQLVWRDFCSMLLQERPDLASGASFQTKCDALVWSNDPAKLEAWKTGRTGSPLVDAAMRELLATGRMHNRCRMVAASYLCKDLDCDWRLGEAHFARHLLDFDFSNNNGGWQWCASTGCDAQPYFRIFNPVAQSRKFDAQGAYIKRWVPELAQCPAAVIHEPSAAKPGALASAGVALGTTYPAPLVDRRVVHQAALAKYKAL